MCECAVVLFCPCDDVERERKKRNVPKKLPAPDSVGAIRQDDVSTSL